MTTSVTQWRHTKLRIAAVKNGEQEKNTSATFRSLVTSSVQCACMGGVRVFGSIDYTILSLCSCRWLNGWSLSSAPLYPSFLHNRWHTSAYYKPIMCSGKLTCGQLISASSTRLVRFGTQNRIRHIFHDGKKIFFFLLFSFSTHTTTTMKTTTARELKWQFFSLAATSISAFISFLMCLFRFISAQIEMDFSICLVWRATSTRDERRLYSYCDMVFPLRKSWSQPCTVSFDHHRIYHFLILQTPIFLCDCFSNAILSTNTSWRGREMLKKK